MLVVHPCQGIYFENCESVPEWRRQMAQTNKQMTHIKEPPIMEHLVARAYQFAGAEQLWIPRVFSVTFWLAGGLFLYLLAREMVSMQGALISTAFYLLVPFGDIYEPQLPAGGTDGHAVSR